MSEQTTPKTRAKGTPKTEAIIGAASNKMVTATKQLNDAVQAALKLTDTLDDQALKIADNEEKLTNLETEYSNKRTQQTIDLELAYKASQKFFAEEYLTSNHFIAIPVEDHEKMEDELTELKLKFDEKVSAEIGKARGMAESAARNATQLAEAEYRAKEAENKAKINQLEAQLAFANQQTTHWQNQLNEERKASVERAKAAQIGNLNVGTAGNGR